MVPKSTATVMQGEDGEDEGRREWKRFLSIVVPAVSQYTGSIHMLRYLCSKLFASFDKSDRFGSRLQRVIQHMRARGISNVTLAEFFERDRVSQVQSGADFASLDSHSQAFVSSLPYLGKLLLLSAYVAGWNPHTSDNRVFGRTKTVKRRRKDPQLMNRKAEKVQEAKLAGPGTFTVDRLMAILRSLFKLEGTYLEDADLMDEFERDGEPVLLADGLRQPSENGVRPPRPFGWRFGLGRVFVGLVHVQTYGSRRTDGRSATDGKQHEGRPKRRKRRR